MNELVLANREGNWHRLKALVLDSVSSPITKRVYNLGLDDREPLFCRLYKKGLSPPIDQFPINSAR